MKDVSIDSHGVRLAVREYGGEGTPLILVHGGPGPNLACWDGFAPRVVDRFRTLAYDQRGHGQSDDADDYSYDALTADIHAIAAAFGLGDAIVVGHSWGGWIALQYAAENTRCRGVVAVDGCLHGHYPSQSEDDWARMEEQLRSEPYSRLFDFVGTPKELKQLVGLTPATYEELRRDYLLRTDGLLVCRHSASSVMALNRAVDAHEPPGEDTYERIPCPVMLVIATEGPFSDAVRPVMQAYPKLRVEWLSCGHDVPRERPGELAALVIDFADSLTV